MRRGRRGGSLKLIWSSLMRFVCNFSEIFLASHSDIWCNFFEFHVDIQALLQPSWQDISSTGTAGFQI